jgi:hypothetical protein
MILPKALHGSTALQTSTLNRLLPGIARLEKPSKVNNGTKAAKASIAVSKRQLVNGTVLIITRLLHRSRRIGKTS